MENKDINFENLQALIRAFGESGIKPLRNKPKDNLFEIAGYPHYENVVSNILAFFFDTEKEEHGYKDCWIKSLINCYLSKYPRDEIYADSIKTTNIEREYSNGDTKRIDLLIDCESFLIIVENKIYADYYNDMDAYVDMAKNYLKSENKEATIIKIVLSLNTVDYIVQNDVINVTYDELIREVRVNEKKYNPNEKWKLLNNEFIENIKRRKYRMTVNRRWIEFAETNNEKVLDLLKVYNEDCEERLNFCKALNKEIKSIDESFECGTYSGGKTDPYYSVYLNLRRPDGVVVCLETYIMKRPTKKKYEDYDKIYLALWSRVQTGYEYLNELVKVVGVTNAIQHKTDGWKEQYLLQILSVDEVDVVKLAKDIVDYASAIRDHDKKD